MKLLLVMLFVTGLSMTAMAQTPLKFAFQGVARNTNGQPVANQKVNLRFTIHEGSEAGNAVYQETQDPFTNANGVFNVSIGSGTVNTGSMASVKWADATYFLQVELDPAGGFSYQSISTTQLMSVPYALMTRSIAGQGAVNPGTNANTMGYYTKAPGENALAIGYGNTASGNASFAAGTGSTASAASSFAMGMDANATANYAVAIGQHVEASGVQSIAIGNGPGTIAGGKQAIAMGNWAQAIGDYSFVMGTFAKTAHPGAFIITDHRSAITTLTNSTADNQMTMRFAGGYRLLTSSGYDGNAAPGVSLVPNGNSWASISDSTKKENYRQPDGLDFLSKIKGMKIGSWNYKGQDKQQYRHYGPMAQEFYSLFGHDGVGIIGNDTTIASADIDGVMMIAIQALVKKADELTTANKKLQQRVLQLEATRKRNKKQS